MRFHLHYVAGRAEERLTFDLQPVVGARMGYTRHGRQDGVERFMRHYFLTAREVVAADPRAGAGILRAALGPPAVAPETDAALLQARLRAGRRQADAGRAAATSTTSRCRCCASCRWRATAAWSCIRWRCASLIRNERRADRSCAATEAAAELFMDLLCGRATRDAAAAHPDGARWLAVLNETGFLGRFLPDWARIVGQMQFDTYHVYTVDEHTIEAIRVLNALERGELARDRAGRLRPGRPAAVAPRAVSGDAAARHRQGPRRRPFARSAPNSP